MNTMKKRMLIALLVAIVLAFFDAWLYSSSIPRMWNIGQPMLWYILTNRVLIGFFIAITGVFTIHPIFGFKMFPMFRGICIGILISIPMAVSAFFDTNATWMAFWAIIFLGVIYGVIIDFFATKYGGQGKKLLDPREE